MSDCGCNGNQSSPPGSTVAKTSASAFAGIAQVRRGPCGPPTCPQPPVSESDERIPHCPGWTSLLKNAVAGKLMVVLEGCIYFLKSKCTGYVHYDADTESVTIKHPDAVSSLPRESRWGWLAKVIPTTRKVCVDGQDACAEEVHQELAAQVMNQAKCGQLVVARPPLCGEVNKGNDMNPDTQVRLDFLNPDNHEEVGCPSEVRFLVGRPGNLGDAAQTACMMWSLMRRLTMLRSQLGQVETGTPDEEAAFLPIFIPVAGGAVDDPCYQLRLSQRRVNAGLPTVADDCDTVEFRGKGTPSEGWKAVPKGLSFHPVALQDLFTTGNAGTAGTMDLDLPDFPVNVCGAVWARLEVVINTAIGTSGATARLTLQNRADDLVLGSNGQGHDYYAVQVSCPTVEGQLRLKRTKSGAASAAISLFVRLIGYEY